MQIKTTMRYTISHRSESPAAIKKLTSNKCWRGCGGKGALSYCCWECKLAQPLWRTVWRFLKTLERELPLVQFSSVAQLCPTLCDPMNRSTPGLPVHHQLPEFTQTHVHRVGDAIQPSHPLSSLFPPAPSPSQHQSLFQWVSSSREVAIRPSNPTAGHTHWGNQNWKRHMYPNVHRSTVYNSQDMEATSMSIGRQMDKKAVVHIHNWILLSN